MQERPVFISYSSIDVEIAQRICLALERGGCPCWISSRDIKPGENYMTAIVRAIQQAKVMILVFSANSNESEEITKELSLASKNKLVVIPARVEDVDPSGGLVYEFATRQWIDMFLDWDAATDGLTARVKAVLGGLERASVGDEGAADREAPEKIVAVSPPKRRQAPILTFGLVASVVVGLLTYQALRSYNAPAPAPPPPPPESQSSPSPVSRTPLPAAIAGKPPESSAIGDGGQVFRDCSDCPVLTVIPGGTATIGSPGTESGHDPSEEPRRRVTFAHPVAIGRSAITFAEWGACVAEGGCNHYSPTDMGWGRADRPVIFVSWSDAQAFVAWLSQKTGQKYRLPSEAEWEFAARGCRFAACSDRAFWFGDASDPDRANYDWRLSYGGGTKAQAAGKTLPTSRFGPNPLGLYDAVGNVSQWVEDCWNPDLRDLPADGSARRKGDCGSHVIRGGSWMDDPLFLRSAARKYEVLSSRLPTLGFRVMRELVR